eukprot:11947542-Ditylum_brightwellii.AAC.1
MEEFTATLEKWEQGIIDNVETLVSLDRLMVFMQQGKCLIATDGSASDNMMSFVWKVVGVDDNVYFCHASLVLEVMNIKTEFKHVKGHQDDVKHFEKLDLPAQLNVDVDFLAVDYRTTKGMKCTMVPQLLINKAQL